MKKLITILLMIIGILGLASLNGEEIKITNDSDNDFKQALFRQEVWFLVSPFFMTNVQQVDIENEANKQVIKYYKSIENDFNKAIDKYAIKELQVRILIGFTIGGFSIVFGLVSGLIVFAVLSYYYPRGIP